MTAQAPTEGMVVGSNLERVLRAGHFAVCGEMGPPQSCSAQAVLNKVSLFKGNVATSEPVLCRVHSGSVVGDIFSSTPVDGGSNLREAILAIEKAGAGVILYIPPKCDLMKEIDAIHGKRGDGGGQPWTLREFGLGAQVLADLGVQQLRLLTTSQLKIAGLTGVGLKAKDRVPPVSTQGEGWSGRQ